MLGALPIELKQTTSLCNNCFSLLLNCLLISLTDHLVQKILSFFLFCLLYCQVIILIGNKADLEAQRDVTYEEAKQFAEENGEPDTE